MFELEIKNLNKSYKLGNKTTFRALTDLNVAFKKGELVSIVGESGSGKSTLMNVIGGLDSDFEGAINVGGVNIKTLTDKELDEYRKKKIGFVFQSFNLIPHLSILENVTIALTLSNVKESEKVKKATAILKRLGLEQQLKKKPNQLSGGQKQRVAIARALINDPEIILADEPTGALDSMTTLQILDILKEIADDGKLVIMVTHSEKVASISSRVVEIADGKIIRDEKKKGYKKSRKKEKLTDLEIEPTEQERDKKKKELSKTHLPLWSAMKLAFHNMWASKVKNLLIAFGVSISLVSLILMLAFGSGLTDYIDSMANEYANPFYVTVTKKSSESNSSGGTSFMAPQQFKDEEIDAIISDINGKLEEEGYDFRADKETNVTYGFNIMTYFNQSASYSYNTGVEGEEPVQGMIFYLYTTPSYYNESNLICGKMPVDGEIMISSAIAKNLKMTNEQVLGKEVDLHITYGTLEIDKKVKIAAVVNVQMFDAFPVMYVNYDYLNGIVVEETKDTENPIKLEPTSIYIETDAEKTTKFITKYLDSRNDVSGSVEQQFAGMFKEMISTFSLALAIIAGISLFVAMIMILVVLYMSVTERTREIGVLKSIGARRRDIKRIFSSESFLIGVLSGIVGCALSLLLGGIMVIVLNAVLGFAPISFRWWYFLLALGISVFISMISGLLPAAKAAKLDPVESLRHE